MNSFTRLGVALLCAMAFAAQADVNVGVTLSATGPAASSASPRRTPSR